jgi:dolichol-phosphate mannosyltransferase
MIIVLNPINGRYSKSLTTIAACVKITGKNFEIIVIDDGSTDGMSEELLRFAADNSYICPIVLSRNFGKEAALQAGLDAASGSAVILIDADLQHPPEIISSMVKLWEQGYDVVNAVKATRGEESFLYRWFAKLFNQLLSGAVGRDCRSASDYKLLDRMVVEALKNCPERGRFFRGLVAWIGFRDTTIEFHVTKRAGGTSKWKPFSLILYSIRNLMAFSSLPLKVVAMFGFVTAAGGLLLGLQTLVRYFSGTAISGFTTVIVLIILFSGAILTSLGIIAMYLGMIYEEQKMRPLYVVRRPPELMARSTQGVHQGDSINEAEDNHEFSFHK